MSQSTTTARPTQAQRLASLEETQAQILRGLATLTSLLEGNAPAKATQAGTPEAPEVTYRCKGTAASTAKRCKRVTGERFCPQHKAQEGLSKAERMPAPKVTKGSQQPKVAGGTLSRKDWNHTLTAKARMAGKASDGKSVYSHVIAGWAEAKALFEQGLTPDQALAHFTA